MGVDVELWATLPAHPNLDDSGSIADIIAALRALPDVHDVHMDRGRRINVSSLCRYFGPGYEGGHWPTIRKLIKAAQVIVPNGLEYGGDSSDSGREVDDVFIDELDRLWFDSRDAMQARLSERVNAALNRELERWRHGNTIEGDFICPNEANALELTAGIQRLTERLDACADMVVEIGQYQIRVEELEAKNLELVQALEHANDAWESTLKDQWHERGSREWSDFATEDQRAIKRHRDIIERARPEEPKT